METQSFSSQMVCGTISIVRFFTYVVICIRSLENSVRIDHTEKYAQEDNFLKLSSGGNFRYFVDLTCEPKVSLRGGR